MTRKDGGTAFPMQDPQAVHAYAQAATEAAKHDNVEDRDQTYIAARAEAVGGMSLRDYFAAKVVISDDVSISSAEIVVGREMPFFQKNPIGNSKFWAEYRARMRYIEADAMLAERAK